MENLTLPPKLIACTAAVSSVRKLILSHKRVRHRKLKDSTSKLLKVVDLLLQEDQTQLRPH